MSLERGTRLGPYEIDSVLGAGGMLIYPPHVLAEMRAICARHRVLFIADEVMTGWGRTGTVLACEQADIVPDIRATAPMSATRSSVRSSPANPHMSDRRYPCPPVRHLGTQGSRQAARMARATRSVPNAVRIARYSSPVAAMTAE